MKNLVRKLYDYLAARPEGEVRKDCGMVLSMLAECWDCISGTEVESTFSNKLHRAEDLHWENPVLSFKLERHGATVNGSSRASLHSWEVDLRAEKAIVDTSRRRQLYPQARPFTQKQASAIAAEVADRIQKNLEDTRFRKDKEGATVIILKACLGEYAVCHEQTASGRRKRIKKALVEQMAQRGWQTVPRNNFLTFKEKGEV